MCSPLPLPGPVESLGQVSTGSIAKGSFLERHGIWRILRRALCRTQGEIGMPKWIASNWERVLFAGFGLVFFFYSLTYINVASVAASSAAFVMGFMCFVFSSVARFKRFKGLGFEAELWDDKQKEAAVLLDRLKDIVAIYSREVVMSKVASGRWGTGRGKWEEHWALFNDLTKQHDDLGQKIDFKGLKAEVDRYFIFDIVIRLAEQLREPIRKGTTEARKIIENEFGRAVKDIDGYNKRTAQLREVPTEPKDLFEVAKSDDVAAVLVKWAGEAQERLKANFGVEVVLDEDVLAKLAEVSDAYKNRPVKVTERLISLANGD